LPADGTTELAADGINALLALVLLMHFKQMALLNLQLMGICALIIVGTNALPDDGTAWN
jgi:hypothetical protein